MTPVTLTGITWDHSRALPPLVATAQRYEETHPGVRIRWEKRSLHEFGHMPVDMLAEKFDLIVIDHPWAGFVFSRKLMHDLAPLLDKAVYQELATRSVGPSFESYVYEGKLLAIPIDAATPAASYRADLLETAGIQVPGTWSDVVELARRGLAVMPGFPADLYLNFTMLCHALGGRMFGDRERMVDRETGLAALAMLRELAAHMPAEIYGWNPIRIAELLSTTDRFAYCPFAYSYNNYSRVGFAKHVVTYADLVSLDDGRPLRSVIGGTGIAISSHCKHVELALDYSLFTGTAAVQSGIYMTAGGQPSRLEAWENEAANRLCGNFFHNTRRSQNESIIRPRYDGYVPLQEEGGEPLIHCLRDGLDENAALDEVDAAYRRSLPTGDALPAL